MQYNRLRYYDPSIGRFISEDPLSFAAGDSNIYRYVGNNPLFYIDPSGLCGVGAGAGAGAGNNSLSSPPPAPPGVNPPPSAEGGSEYSLDDSVSLTPFGESFGNNSPELNFNFPEPGVEVASLGGFIDDVEDCGFWCTLGRVAKWFVVDEFFDALSKFGTNKPPDGLDPNFWDNLVQQPYNTDFIPGTENLDDLLNGNVNDFLQGDSQEFDPNNINIEPYNPEIDPFNVETFPGANSADDFLNGDVFVFPNGNNFFDFNKPIPDFNDDLRDLLTDVFSSKNSSAYDDFGVPSEPIGDLGKPLKKKWLEKNNIDAHTIKEILPGVAKEFDIYKDRDGNLWGLRKPGYVRNTTPEYLGNLEDFQE